MQPIPDVLFYLGLSVQVEGVRSEESDALLLPPGSVLLLLHKHFSKAL
jgi:hypothetical protein